MPTILNLLETCIYTRDLAALERFYGQVMGLTLISAEHPRYVFFRVSDSSVLLMFNPDETLNQKDIPAHGALGPQHFAFAIDHDQLDAWRAHLTEHGVGIEREHAWPNGARSIYFRDPAGHSVELVTREIWHRG